MDKTMPMLIVEQAKLNVALQSSTRNIIKRIEKLTPTDDIQSTFDLILIDLQKQKLLTRSWSIDLTSFDLALSTVVSSRLLGILRCFAKIW